MAISLKVNGLQRSVPAEADTPLLYVLRNDLALNGAKFGCGLAQCGACTVLLDGRAVRSCVTEIGTIGEAEITTIEGLGTVDTPHPSCRAIFSFPKPLPRSSRIRSQPETVLVTVRSSQYGPGRIRTYDQGIHSAPVFPPGVDYLFTRARCACVWVRDAPACYQGHSSPQVVSAPSAGVPAARLRVAMAQQPKVSLNSSRPLRAFPREGTSSMSPLH